MTVTVLGGSVCLFLLLAAKAHDCWVNADAVWSLQGCVSCDTVWRSTFELFYWQQSGCLQIKAL